MFAAAVGIEADGERDIGAVVFREERLSAVDKKLSARMGMGGDGIGIVDVRGERVGVVGIGRENERLETIGRIRVRAAAVDRGGGIGCGRRHQNRLMKNVAAPV